MNPTSQFDELGLEDAPWEASLAACYREALSGAPSRTLERCIDRLEGEPVEYWEEELLIVEALPGKGRLILRQTLAWGIDGALLAALSLLAGAGGAQGRVLLAFAGISAFAYLTLGGFLGGRTLGDRVAGISTFERASRQGMSLGRAALRSLLTMLGLLSVVGLFWSLIDGSGQTLHDRILGTRTAPVDQP